MSEVKVNKISPRTNCGTVQLGDSGDTITIPAGATITNNGTQTGFGRTGTVNWDTTAKTASFTAVSGNGYFVDTSSSAITVTLPASPSAGDIVGIKDYAITFATNNCTIGRNSSNINGAATDPVLNTNGQSVFLVYVDATKGWIPTQDDTSDLGALYITATGGTVTTCGDYKIHTFTSPGTFCVSSAGNSVGSNSVDYMVIAGGAGGGPANAGGAGGGGGAGGYRESSGTASGSYTIGLPSQNCGVSALPVSASPGCYPITVGAGGALNAVGSNSVFSTITSAGGGKGGCWSGVTGGNGGSGGGSAKSPSGSGGSGNTPPVSPSQGNDGGDNPGNPSENSPSAGSGGGGAGNAGRGVVSNTRGGVGGIGATSSITGTAVARAGGGGSGGNDPGGSGGNNPACAPGTNPLTSTTPSFGAGQGGLPSPGTGGSGTANTGSGGGGGYNSSPGGAGGSGIVVIRYKFQ